MDNKTFRRILGERLGRSAKDVDTLVGALSGLLVENSQVLRVLAVPGFGSFVPVKHEEQIVRDLSSGKRILLPPEIVLEYIPGSAMRRMVDPTAPIPSDAPDAPGGLMTLPMAAETLSETCAIDAEAAERFVSEFFRLIEEEDGRSGEVIIKGIGEFRGLIFKPDQALAEEINQPFSMFEPVELEESLSDSDLENPDFNSTENVEEVSSAAVVEEAEVPVEKDEETTCESIDEPATIGEVVEESETASEAFDESETAGEEAEAEVEEGTEEEADRCEAEAIPETDEEDVEPSRGSNAWLMAAVILGVLFAFAAGFVSGRYSVVPTMHTMPVVDTVYVSVPDTVKAVPAEIESGSEAVADEAPEVREPVYDTVTPTRYLATMARQYYGRMEYWVYIYKANEDKLANPDKIRPGTRVEIPPFERYAKSTNDSVNLEAARRLSEEIYAPYRR